VRNTNSGGNIENTVMGDRKGIVFFLVVLAGAITLLLPAIFNGYPIVNPDDNTYLCSGFIPDTPFDRPITYGLVLRLISLNGMSLFLAALIQCYLVSWLTVKVIRTTFPNRYLLISLFAFLLLSICTSLSWVSSELIPDIFTSVAMMCLYLFLAQKEKPTTTFILFLLYTIAVSTHFSNVMIFFVVLLGLWLFKRRIFELSEYRRATRMIYVAAFLTLASIATMGSALSKSKHVFALASLLEQGILKKYLDETCPTHHYNICEYKESLPKDANVFLWNIESPLYKTGGWGQNQKEYGEIVAATIARPKYLMLRAKMSAIFTAKQAVTFNVGDGNFPIDSPLSVTIRKYIPTDAVLYKSSKQYDGTLLIHSGFFNGIIYLTVSVGVIILIGIAIRKRAANRYLKLFAFLAIATIFVNLWDCATFAQVNGRYSCRVMWLIPFTAYLAICSLREKQLA